MLTSHKTNLFTTSTTSVVSRIKSLPDEYTAVYDNSTLYLIKETCNDYSTFNSNASPCTTKQAYHIINTCKCKRATFCLTKGSKPRSTKQHLCNFKSIYCLIFKWIVNSFMYQCNSRTKSPLSAQYCSTQT